jgi:TonB family protein
MRNAVFLFITLASCGLVSKGLSQPMTDLSGAGEFRSLVSYAPSPPYPYAARALRLVGSGVVDLNVDRKSGRVTSARIEKSTGHKILDDAALDGFRKWRFNSQKMEQFFGQAARQAGKPPPDQSMWKIRMPITYVMAGGVFSAHVRNFVPLQGPHHPVGVRSVSGGPDAIAINTPGPKYPAEARIRHRSSNGVAIVEVDGKTGTVTNAYMNPSTGNAALDDAALAAFRQWRFKPGRAGKFKIPVTYERRRTPNQ